MTADPGPANFSLCRKEGWLQMADSPGRERPELLSVAQLGELNARDRGRYDDARDIWHTNLGPFATPQLERIHDELWDVVASNRHPGPSSRRR